MPRPTAIIDWLTLMPAFAIAWLLAGFDLFSGA